MATQMIFLGAQTDENLWRLIWDCMVYVPSDLNKMFVTAPALFLLCEGGHCHAEESLPWSGVQELAANSLSELLQYDMTFTFSL